MPWSTFGANQKQTNRSCTCILWGQITMAASGLWPRGYLQVHKATSPILISFTSAVSSPLYLSKPQKWEEMFNVQKLIIHYHWKNTKAVGKSRPLGPLCLGSDSRLHYLSLVRLFNIAVYSWVLQFLYLQNYLPHRGVRIKWVNIYKVRQTVPNTWSAMNLLY